MWHEARKQEKKIREAVVDFQKRAERRRQHYAKQRKDPMQLLRVYGRKAPLHLNPAASRMSSNMIPWQGDDTNMISRYDVRVNLDYIPEYSKIPRPSKSVSEEWEEQRCNYERYRFLVINQFRQIPEQEALAAIEVSEMFHIPGESSSSSLSLSRDKSKSQARAAIGYSYGREGETVSQAQRDEQLLAEYLGEDEEDDDNKSSSDSEFEMDVDLDTFSSGDVDRMNVLALEYGIAASSFSKNLRSEKRHLEEAKQARISDIEKAALQGRRSRRERRQMRERARPRITTPPNYARRDSPTYEPYRPERRSRSSSRSSSPGGEGNVEFITEFGGDDEEVGVVSQPVDSAHQSSSLEAVQKSGRGSQNENQTSDRRSRSSRKHSRSPKHRDSHSPRRRKSRSPRRRSSNHRDSRSRSRSRDRSRKRSHYSTSQERRQSRSGSHERGHTHQSSSEATPPQKPKPAQGQGTKAGGSGSKSGKEKVKLTPQERLKKKMQAQLSRQFKQDKKLQKEKEHRKESERIEREEQMRDKMRKMRERDRSNWEREGYRSRSPSPYGYTSAQYDRYY